MKILMVSSVPTDPPDAGNRVRIATLLKGLQDSGHEVHLAHVHSEYHDPDAMQRRMGEGRLHTLPFVCMPPRQRPLPRATRILGRLLKREAAFMWPLDGWYDERITDPLRELDAQHRFDAVFVEYVFMSRAFEAFPERCLRVLDTHDRFGLRHREFLQVGMRPRWFSTSLAEEERGFRRAHAVLAIQETEAAQFRKRLGSGAPRVLHVGHLIELVDPPVPSTRTAAIFLGSFNPINVEGARYFIEQVLPLVREAQPSFELLLAGGVSDKVPDATGVRKLGYVDRIQDAFAQAMLSVNPVLMGTGVNIKMLDALACAMPCISTAAGARGLESCRDAFVTVADHDPRAFAQAVLRLLRAEDERGVLRTRARRAAEAWNMLQLDALAGLFREQALTGFMPAG